MTQPLANPLPRPEGAAADATTLDALTTGLSVATDPPTTALPQVPGYALESVLGRGGMGVVYKARHLALKRAVALKMILGAGHAGEDQRARFKAEAEAVARLQHPNIVQVYEVGEAAGHPFCALELVEGGSLDARLDGRPLTAREAAHLVEALARAMHLAHARNVVHRDLKPGNVLLASDGTPKVTDFGLARHLDADSGVTQAGTVMGTPSYMAPEQASGQAHAAGPPADVYALGAVLYACLTGRPPFKGATVQETLEQVRTRPPVAPRLSQPDTPIDVETICLKCLAKEPEKRYPSAKELADDLGRFLCGEPIAARPVGAPERAWLWCRRNRAVAGLAATLALLFVAASAISAVAAFHFVRLADDRETARSGAEGARTLEKDARDLAEKNRKQAEKDRDLAREEQRRTERALGVGTLAQALTAWRDEDAPAAILLCESVPQRARSWEWGHLRSRFAGTPFTVLAHRGRVSAVCWSPDGRALVTGGEDGALRLRDAASGDERWVVPRAHPDQVATLCFSPDGTRLASAGAGPARVWDSRSGERLLELKGPAGHTRAVSWSPDGSLLATGGDDGQVRLWAATGPDRGAQRRALSPNSGPVFSLGFSPDGRWLATSGRQVKLWDVRTGEPVRARTGPRSDARVLAFSPDGRLLATAGDDHLFVRLWDVFTGRQVRELALEPTPDPNLYVRRHLTGLSFRPDGARLASCRGLVSATGDVAVTRMMDCSVRIWDVESGWPVTSLQGPWSAVACVGYSPDGQRLAAGSVSAEGHCGDLRVWDVRSERDHRLLPGHVGRVQGLAFHPASGRLATVGGTELRRSEAGELKLWAPATGALVLSLPHSRVLTCVDYAPDGKTLAVGGEVGTLERRDATTGNVLQALRGHVGTVVAVQHSPDGKQLVSAGRDGTVRLWGLADGKGRIVLRRDGPLEAARLSPDGTLLAVTAAGKPGAMATDVLLCDLAANGKPVVLGQHARSARALSFSPDGRALASGGGDGLVRVWDVARRRERFRFLAHGGAVVALGHSPDGRRLASSGIDRTVRLWDADTGQEVLALDGPEHPSSSVVFSRDGRWLATCGGGSPIQIRPGDVRLWSSDWPRPLKQLAIGGRAFTAVWFAPDGKRLFAREGEGPPAAWSVPAGQPAEAGGVPAPSRVSRLAFAPDGDFQATAHADGTIHLVDLRPSPGALAERRGQAFSNPAWHDVQARQMNFRIMLDRQAPATLRAYSVAFHARRALRGAPPDIILAQIALNSQRELAEELHRSGDARVGEATRELRRLAEALASAHATSPQALYPIATALLEPMWAGVVPERLASAGGATLTAQPDGSILASGPNPDQDSYALAFRVPEGGIAGLRLEVLPDPAFQGGGPGRAPGNGNFELSEVALSIAGEKGGPERAVRLTGAVASYSAPASRHYLKKDMRPEWAIDGDPKTYWSSFPELGRPQWLVVQTDGPVGKAGELATVRLDFKSANVQHALGRFRLTVTASPRPADAARWLAGLRQQPIGTWTVVAATARFRGDWPAVAAACAKASALPAGETALDAGLLALARGRMGERGPGLAALGRARRLATGRPAGPLLAELLQEAEGVLKK